MENLGGDSVFGGTSSVFVIPPLKEKVGVLDLSFLFLYGYDRNYSFRGNMHGLRGTWHLITKASFV